MPSCVKCAVIDQLSGGIEPIGVCAKCSSLGCYDHGTRLRQSETFRCAICLSPAMLNAAGLVAHEDSSQAPRGGPGGGRGGFTRLADGGRWGWACAHSRRVRDVPPDRPPRRELGRAPRPCEGGRRRSRRFRACVPGRREPVGARRAHGCHERRKPRTTGSATRASCRVARSGPLRLHSGSSTRSSPTRWEWRPGRSALTRAVRFRSRGSSWCRTSGCSSPCWRGLASSPSHERRPPVALDRGEAGAQRLTGRRARGTARLRRSRSRRGLAGEGAHTITARASQGPGWRGCDGARHHNHTSRPTRTCSTPSTVSSTPSFPSRR